MLLATMFTILYIKGLNDAYKMPQVSCPAIVTQEQALNDYLLQDESIKADLLHCYCKSELKSAFSKKKNPVTELQMEFGPNGENGKLCQNWL